MFIIGITGGIGCGKSTAADMCREYGLPVLDADKISKEVTSEGGSAVEEISGEFGSSMIDENMSLDRQKMADLVFKDKNALDKLSRIVHKHVISSMHDSIEEYKKEKIKALVLDVPIPVKEGFLDICDQVWLIWTKDEIRIRRLAERGMSEQEAKRRISYQMSREEYEKLAHLVIENDGTIDELRDTVNKNLDKELHMRGIKL